MRIRFTVTGTCEQEIALEPGCKYTPKQIIDALNGDSGESIYTSLDGEILEKWDVGGQGSVLGRIEESDFDSEYTDFELVED